MKNIKLLIAFAFLFFGTAKAQYETHLLSYTTLCINTADVDGDGDADIVSGGLNNLQWQENNGNGLFYSHTITQNQTEVHAAEIVDIDKDGDKDIVTASYIDGSVYWMENDGNQNFTSHVLTNLVSGSVSLDVKDLDDDGDSDIVCAAYLGDKIYWLQNNGNQAFTLITILSNFDGAISVAAADIDKDGDMDIAAASQLDSTFLWLENDGNEVFTSHILSSTINTPSKISFDDVDNDTDLDLLYASSGGCGWYSNNLAVFTKNAITTGDFRDLLFTDVDNDGDKDPVYVSYLNDYVTWVKNNGNLTFVSGGYLDQSFDRGTMLRANDLNGDGKMDIIAASGFEVKIYINGVSQIFTKNLLNRYLSDANYACHGDFDNDGDIDLMAVGYFNINFYRNDGGGFFTTKLVFPTTVSFAGQQIRAADMDGDGDMDAVYTETDGNLVSWIENQGAGVFTKRIVASLQYPYAVYPIDFDFDGDMDVVTSRVQTTSTSAVFWYENDGTENFTQHLVDAAYHYGVDIFPVDYNLDGYMDVIGAYSGAAGSQKIVLHYNSAAGFNNTNYVLNNSAPGVNSIFAIDMDADADMDVLSANYTNNTIVWYENPGQIQHVIDNNALGATYVYAADLDNDGDIDVASTSRNDNEINWYRNNGNLSFTKINIAQNVPDPEVILACDLDSDNVLELYSTCSSSESVAYYKLPPPPPPIALTDCGELFISEYIEGTSNNKAIEIYNPTADTISLSGYQIHVYSNGNGSPNQTFNLSTIILPFDVYIVAHPSSIPGILNAADTTFGFNFNGDDAVELAKNGSSIDIIGKIGQDPGTAWSMGGISTLNATLVRNYNFTKGNNLHGSFDPSIEWSYYPTDDTSNLKAHNSLCINYCPPSINISATDDTICSSTTVLFTATVSNEGLAPSYQWKINGINTGGNTATFSSDSLMNHDIVTCLLTSSLACAISPILSNEIKITVNPVIIPSITIIASDTIPCNGTSVNFSASVSNGNIIPSYQWKKNSVTVGLNSPTYVLQNPSSNDTVSCTISSNAPCATAATVSSNNIVIKALSSVVASVAISVNDSSICAGTTLNFAAIPYNGGTAPLYQWKKNGVNISGANAPTYSTSNVANNSIFSCVLSGSLACSTNPTAESNTISIDVTPLITPTISISPSATVLCKDDNITFTAAALNGGTNPQYQWRKGGIAIPGAISATYSTTTLANGNSISCQFISNATCTTLNTVNSNSISLQVLPLPVVVASANGNLLSTTSFAFYQWLRNNLPTANGTNQTYTVIQNGNYRVIGFSGVNGCSDTSNTLSFNSVGINSESLEKGIVISPNPSNGIFNLTFNETSEKTIEVTDILGKTIYKNKLDQNKLEYKIDLTQISKGIYFISIHSKDQKVTRRIRID